MGGGISEVVTIDQCEEMEKELKKEYGDDFLTNREKFPLTSQALSLLASTPCKERFGYDGLVTEYCTDIKHYTDQIGGGQTCANKTDTATRSRWCLADRTGVRFLTDGKCEKNLLGDQYHPTSSSFCRDNPTNQWCTCYNLKNKICMSNPNAAGCKYYKILEDNRTSFGEEPKIEDPDNPGKMITCSADKHGPCPYSEGFKILRDNAHCRPRACDPEMGYVPVNVKSDCQPSYKFCDKDMNIQSMSNNDIVIECNGPNFGSLPDWWDEPSDPDFWKDDREPPFDKFPLNKLPITRFPKKFDWGNKNVRYLTYTGVSSISSCCCCLLLIMLSLKRR
jgi:hypothetical protein